MVVLKEKNKAIYKYEFENKEHMEYFVKIMHKIFFEFCMENYQHYYEINTREEKGMHVLTIILSKYRKYCGSEGLN